MLIVIVVVDFFFGCAMQHVGSLFPEQESNLHPCLGSTES